MTSGCTYMHGSFCDGIADALAYTNDHLKELTNKHIMQNQTEEKKEFEPKVVFPVNHSDIYDNYKYGCGHTVGIVSAEWAKEIYEIIGRQLKGLALTETKAKAVRKGKKK